ncbi:MAG: ATP-binding protein [Elusimicrobiota bacterium]
MTTVIIVGAGKRGAALLALLQKVSEIEVVGIADIDANAPGMIMARSLGVRTSSDAVSFIKSVEAKQIIDATGSAEVHEQLARSKPSDAELISGRTAATIGSVVAKCLEAERSHRRAKEYAEQLLDITPSAIFTVDKERRITGWNKSCERITGYSAAEAVGQSCKLFANEPCGKGCGAFNDKVCKPVIGKGCKVRAKDGRLRDIVKNVDVLRGPDGEVCGAVECFEDITERKAEDNKLAEQYSFTDSVIESIADPLYVIDVKSKQVIKANSTALKTWGLTCLPEHGTCYSLTHKRDEPCENAGESCPIAQVLRTRASVTVEHTHRYPDGSVRIVEVHGHPIKDENGEVVRMIEHCVDVTEKRRQEEAVRAAHHFNETLLSTIPFPMDIVAKDGTILFINDKFRAALGRDIVGQKCWQVYKDDQKMCVDCPLRKPIKQGEISVIESPGVLGGRVFQVTHTGMTYQGQEALLEIFEDITDRIQAAEQLAERNHQLDERVKELNCLYGISRIAEKPGAKLEHILQNVTDLLPLGWQHPEITCARVIFEDREYTTANFVSSPWHLSADIPCGAKSAGRIDIHYLEERPEAAEGPFAAEERHLLDAAAGRIGEIARRKRAEAEVRKATEMKSGFVSMVSHELRTPLTAIKEGIDIVIDGTAGEVSEDQKQFLDLAKRNVDRLARLINDVLSFQKLEVGKTEMLLVEDDIMPAVKETLAALTPTARAKGLALELRNGHVLPKARFDRDKIVQVLTNLLNNAVKFTERGTIAVAAAEDADGLRICVEDTGPGIAAEDMPRLFSSFEQFGAAKAMTGGTGLGLAISKQIIEKHGGRIWAESEPGQGTRFYFTLPIGRE